jgi:HPt (histidine-containing phosphotransfer) domain-containing protein
VHTTETSVPVLDESVLSELQTLGAELVAEIFDLFVSDVPHRVARLRHAIDDRSRDSVLHEAHGLKGSALALGAARFAGLCAAIEHDARDGQLDQAAARSSTLETEFSEVRRAMKEMGLVRDARV